MIRKVFGLPSGEKSENSFIFDAEAILRSPKKWALLCKRWIAFLSPLRDGLTRMVLRHNVARVAGGVWSATYETRKIHEKSHRTSFHLQFKAESARRVVKNHRKSRR